MNRFLLSFAILWLLNVVSAVQNDLKDLYPIPRHVWDKAAFTRKDNTTDKVALRDHGEFMWGSEEDANSTVTALSMVVYAKQDERILDLDRVALALESVTCGDKMVLKFKNKLFYAAAKLAWSWVNFNDQRSFVVVTDWEGCGDPKVRSPWVVSKVAFDDKSSSATLDATKSTWKKIANTYTMDFGDVEFGHAGRKKNNPALAAELSKAFTVDLSSEFPVEFANWTMNNSYVDARLAITCDECGTQGSVKFTGHIEGSIFGGLEKLEVSAKPQGVEAHVGVGLDFQGEVSFKNGKKPQDEFTLLELPLPSGWRVPGLLTFGPNVKINAGYSIEEIIGTAHVGTGITASIPDKSIAKVDLASKNKVDISGWKPKIEADPLDASVQIDATAELYTEIAVAASIEVLDENGINVEIALRIPDITVSASAGYNSEGFCDAGPEHPFGVQFDATLGVKLGLQGYTEVNDDRDVFLDLTIFEAPELYTFPELCLDFDEQSPGACIPEQNFFDPIDSYLPDGYGESDDQEAGVSKRSGALVKRDEASAANWNKRKPYFLDCDTKKEFSIRPQKYQGPSDLKHVKGVPIMKAGMSCSQDNSTKCPAHQWTIEPLPEDPTEEELAVVTDKWASEHIYEGNWVRDYIARVVKSYPELPDDADVEEDRKICKGAVDTFGRALAAKIDTPTPNDAANYSEALMQNIATTWTSQELMAVVPQIQNGMKYNMFQGFELIGKKKWKEMNLNQKVCALGRAVTVCKYMNHEKIRARMAKTVERVEDVLKELDADKEVYKPADFKFVEAHKKWFPEVYKKGFENARKRLTTYVGRLSEDDLEDLDEDTREAVKNAASNCEMKWPLT